MALTIAIIFLIGFFVLRVISRTISVVEDQGDTKSYRIFSYICLILMIFALLKSCLFIVRPGQVGVGVLLGRVRPGVFHSGLRVKNPLMSVIIFPTRIQEYTMSTVKGEGRKAEADDAITALTKEGLPVQLDLTIWYRVNPEEAPGIYEKIGTDYESKIVRPSIRTAIRTVLPRYPAKAIYSGEREKIAIELQQLIEKDITGKGFICDRALLRNVVLPKRLTDAINEKLAAEQEAQKMEFVLLKAGKEAKVRVVEAKGIAESQRIINKTLTLNYLQHEAIVTLEKLAGSPNTTFVIVPTSTKGTGLPLILGTK